MFRFFNKNAYFFNYLKRFYSNQIQTHYDILNLKPNCTAKEIRDAFLKLSKEHHPDMKGPKNDPKNTARFVKINEAYNVLSKRSLRESYDLTLQNMYTAANHPTNIRMNVRNAPSWTDFHNSNPNPGPYYGVKGIEKVSNLRILGILLIIATIGTAIEFYLVRHSLTFRRDRLDETSREASLQHANVRADAEKYGNKMQLQRITEKILRTSEN